MTFRTPASWKSIIKRSGFFIPRLYGTFFRSVLYPALVNSLCWAVSMCSCAHIASDEEKPVGWFEMRSGVLSGAGSRDRRCAPLPAYPPTRCYSIAIQGYMWGYICAGESERGHPCGRAVYIYGYVGLYAWRQERGREEEGKWEGEGEG